MKKVLVIGCGKMGSAIINGWLNKKIRLDIHVIDKQVKSKKLLVNKKVSFYRDFNTFNKREIKLDFVLIAIKPQQISHIKEDLFQIYNNRIVCISIMAGVSTKWFKQNIANNMKIVRAMPNIPASVLKGVTGVFCSNNIDKKLLISIQNVMDFMDFWKL